MSRALQIRPLFSAEEVEARVESLAREMLGSYSGTTLHVVSIAEGAVRFTDALVEALAEHGVDADVQTVRAHRSDGMSLGSLQIESFDVSALDGREVLVVDDIADEGRTLRAILDLVELSEARSVRTAVLINKLERRREPIQLDYVGFEVASGWVVGFGMDVEGELRDLDEIGVVEPGLDGSDGPT